MLKKNIQSLYYLIFKVVFEINLTTSKICIVTVHNLFFNLQGDRQRVLKIKFFIRVMLNVK